MDFKQYVKQNKISIITLANSGYLHFTRNCIQSLKNLGLDNIIVVYCVDEDCYSELKKEYDNVELLTHSERNVGQLHTFPKRVRRMLRNKQTESGFKNVTFLKFCAIEKSFKDSSYVLFVDSDVVFLKHDFLETIHTQINNKEFLVQSESDGVDQNTVCTGLMYIRKNIETKKFFNWNTARLDENYELFISDQDYVQSNLKKLKNDFLSLEEFPNGRYFSKHKNKIDPSIVHYNWASKSYNKIKSMKQDGVWYI